MRSGLQKPGAIPFFALLVFSLLSLVPSLSSHWGFYSSKVGYIGYRPKEQQHLPRVKDDTVTARSVVSGHCQSRLRDGFYQPCPDRVRLASKDAPYRSPSEAAPVLDSTPPTYGPTESSTLTKGVRAFRTFFIQQPFLQSFSTRGAVSVKTAPSRLTSTVENASATPIAPSYNYTTPATKGLDEKHRLRTLFLEIWQQACHAGIDLLGRIDALSTGQQVRYYRSLCSYYVGSFTGRDLFPTSPDQQSGAIQLPQNGSHLYPSLQPTATQAVAMPTQAPDSPPTTAEESKVAGVGRNSEQMRSSCMAIVIGLVVGIMWF